MAYIVDLNWDEEARVWVATSEDIHGLVLESESLDDLIKKVTDAVPELLDFNMQERKGRRISIQFRAERLAEAYI